MTAGRNSWETLRDGPWHPIEPTPEGLLLNHASSAALGEKIIALIDAAGSLEPLLLITPLLDDGRVLDAIIKARKRGARIKLITEARRRTHGNYVIRAADYGFTVDEQLQANLHHHRALGRLCNENVDVRGFHFCSHAKLALLGEREAIISSANLTANSLGWGQPVVEAGLLLHEPKMLSALLHSSTALWQQAPLAFHIIADEEQTGYSIQSRSSRIAEVTPEMETTNGSVLWNLPGVASPLALRIAHAIESARKRVILCAYTLYELDRGVQKIESAVLGALRRGVEVVALVRSNNDSILSKGWPDLSTRGLVKAGMLLLGISGLHAKGLLVDENVCGIFSANFNRFSLSHESSTALEVPDLELGIVGAANSMPLKPLAQWLHTLPAYATHRWVA